MNAFSKDSDIVNIILETKASMYMLKSNNEKSIVFSSGLIELKTKKDSKGVLVLKLNSNSELKEALKLKEGDEESLKDIVVEKIPAVGKKYSKQLSLKY